MVVELLSAERWLANLIALLIDVSEQAGRELGYLLRADGDAATDDAVDGVLLYAARYHGQPNATGREHVLHVGRIGCVQMTDAMRKGAHAYSLPETESDLPAR
jgi:hypothetical protein